MYIIAAAKKAEKTVQCRNIKKYIESVTINKKQERREDSKKEVFDQTN